MSETKEQQTAVATTPTAAGQRLGKYRVHPAALVMPEMSAELYQALWTSIHFKGQQVPILVQGEWLLDGRHRMRACLDLGIEPRVEEYTGTLMPAQLVMAMNATRRDLTRDQRAAACAALVRMATEEQAAQNKRSGKSADGTAGGRGKTLLRNHSKVSDAPSADRNARSTVGQIAAAENVSHHVAAQAVAVDKHAPDLAAKVKAGKMSLNDAAKETTARKKQTTPTKERKPRAVNRPRSVQVEPTVEGFARAIRQHLTDAQRETLKAEL
jgi:ParB-like chromosome segregation protein Spo0J